MAYFSFTRAILEGRPIDIFNHGKMMRDFTYIDDIVEGIIRAADHAARPAENWNSDKPDPGASFVPWRIYNIGNNQPVELLHFVETLEHCLDRKAVKNLLPIQIGDVPATFADVDDLMTNTGFKPSTPIEVGISRFVEWYRRYYGVPG
jgi:UDP-glucuronate 4-epimerase